MSRLTLSERATHAAEKRREQRRQERNQAEMERMRKVREEAEEKTRHLRLALEETFGPAMWELIHWYNPPRQGSQEGVAAVFRDTADEEQVAIWAVADPKGTVHFTVAEQGRGNRWQRGHVRLADLADLGDYILDRNQPRADATRREDPGLPPSVV